MFDRILSVIVVVVGVVAIICGAFLALNAAGSLFEELMWLFSVACTAMGSVLLLWQLKGKRWLRTLLTWDS